MTLRTLAALSAALLAAPAFAQTGPKLPRVSPNAKVSQTVGYTDVSVEYSSPGVKGRKIWGAVVPYGQVWRCGANEPSKVTFSTDATIDGKKVPAGTYAYYAIPGESEWTIILSKELKLWGAFGYKPDADLLRLTVKPETMPTSRERMAFGFLDTTDGGATLVLAWEKLRISVPFTVDTKTAVMKEIKAIKGTDPKPYTAAARYLLDSNQEPELAMELTDTSIKHKEEWLNIWTKAQLTFKKGDKPAALKLATRANELGAKSDNFFYKDQVTAALTEWK